MTVEKFLKTLKTAKRVCPSSLSSIKNGAINSSQTPFNDLINSNSSSSTNNNNNNNNNTLESFLTSLTSHQLHTFLTDPSIKTSDCFRIFSLVLHSQSSLSFKPDFYAHFTLICRLIKSRFFTDAEFLLDKLVIDPNCRYTFKDFVHYIEKYCKESKIITKMLNMLLKKYSDHGLFDMASATFDYMVEKTIDRDEKTCSVHLHAMIKAKNTDLAYEFFRRMLDSGMEVSVFSLTIVVDGLCKVGELTVARELVEEMSKKGTKPNIITFNTLVDACVRRLDLAGLQLVLRLMEDEGIQFDDATYKLLIEGYTASGKVEAAEKMLLEMHDKNIEVDSYFYLTVIRGYCRLEKAGSGLLLFNKLKEKGLLVLPSVEIYRSLISGLCKVGEMGLVKELYVEMHKNGLALDDNMFKALVDGYQKAGMIDELAELQCAMKVKGSPIHWSSIDDECKVELAIGDEANLEMMDGLNDVKNDTGEEMVIDDVLEAYSSPKKH